MMNARVPRGPPGPSVEKRGETKCRFSLRKKSARLRGSQVIEEPCVSGEDSSSIRLALVPDILSTVLFLFYRFLPIFTDFSDFLVGVLPGVLFTR